MEVFNKIYSQVSSSVSSTVSQLSGVLPGNPVTREYTANLHVASAGPGLLWKIYRGVKNSTKQEASIFVFEKRQLEKWGKADRDIILESLKRGVTQLTKLRHPKVLTVQHSLEESRESLAFATEPVFASLANVLGHTYNMPQPANISDYKLFDIEIKYGLLQLSEGLTFLHNDVKLLHRNIAPESVIINSQGAWKIFGFDFCVLSTSPPNEPPTFPFMDYTTTIPAEARPNIDYLSPEIVLNSTHSIASDLFSLGMLTYTVHSPTKSTLNPVKDIQQFRGRVQMLKNLSSSKLQCLPEALKEFVKLMLSVNVEHRPDAHQFIKIPYFDDVGIKTLTYLDSLLQWDNLQKSQFYKGLPEALSKLPQRVKVQRVLSCLVRDLAQPAMVPFILPSIFDIASDCTKEEFCLYILPHLKPVMKLLEPVQIMFLLLQKMELLLKLTPAEDIQQHVLPMLYRGLDSDLPQIHELCLSVLPTFAGLLDHSNVKNHLLPRIKKLCLSTNNLSVRVNCLLCIGRLLENLDKWLVLDEVLPFLPQITSREPAVLMGILGIYKIALTHKKLGITKEVLATRVIPFLTPLCIENGLTLSQFNAITSLVKEMFKNVEEEHRTKLEQLNSVKDQQKKLADNLPAISQTHSKNTELNQAFSGLGLDSFVPTASPKVPTDLFLNQPPLEPTNPQKSPQAKDLSQTLMPKTQWGQSAAGTSSQWGQSPTKPSLQQWGAVTTTPQNAASPQGNMSSQWGQLVSPSQNMASSVVGSQRTNTQWGNNVSAKQIGMGTPTSPQQNWGQFAQSNTSTNITSNQIGMSSLGTPTSPQQNWGHSPQNAFQSSSNLNSFGANNPWNSSKMGTPVGTASSGNWGALDDLLPSANSASKMPMNSMQNVRQSSPFGNVNQPLIGAKEGDSNSKSNLLSNDDIMDLLS